jgi:hypothetical protein
MGHFHQIGTLPMLAACPLHLQERPNVGTAAKRRDVPIGDISGAQIAVYSITSLARASTVGGTSIGIRGTVRFLREVALGRLKRSMKPGNLVAAR